MDKGSTAEVTINTEATPTPLPDEEKPPDLKKPRTITPPANCSAPISSTELLAVRQLIQGQRSIALSQKLYSKLFNTGYRESAVFLSRAADQLEQMLTKDENNTTQ